MVTDLTDTEDQTDKVVGNEVDFKEIGLKYGDANESDFVIQSLSTTVKPNEFFVKTLFFLLIVLLLDFTKLIKQKIVKKGCFFYKNTIKRIQDFSKKHRCFYKNSIYVFLPQHKLKEQ